MRVLISFFLLTISLSVQSQSNLDWVKTFGTNQVNATSSAVADIVNDVLGNTYFIGQFVDSTTFVDDSITVMGDGPISLVFGKISFEGELLWVKSLGGYVTPMDIDIDSENNILISGGFSQSVDFDLSANESILNSSQGSGYLLKIDENGNFINVDQFFQGGVVCKDDFGNIYYANRFIDYADNFRDGFQVHKISSNFDVVWTKEVLETSGQMISPNEMDFFNDSLIIVGVFEGSYDFNPDTLEENIVYSQFGESYFILSLNSDGEFNFQKSILGSNQIPTDIKDIEVGNDSCIYIVGDFQDVLDFDPDTSVYELESYDTDIFVAKYSLSGNLIWAKSFYNNWVQFGYSLFLDTLNNIYLTGTFSGANFDFDPNEGTVILSEPYMSDNAFILNLSSEGTFNFAYIFKSLQNSSRSGGNEISFAQNSIFLGGAFNQNLYFEPNQESHLVYVLGDAGNGYVLKINASNLYLGELQKANEFHFYPNPANNYLQLNESQGKEVLSLKIYNSNSQLVKTITNFSKTNNVSISDLQNGSYFVVVETKSGTIVRKLIAE